ncbi:hypothetical protein QQ045_001531 [Rhodiola kirilowii]
MDEENFVRTLGQDEMELLCDLEMEATEVRKLFGRALRIRKLSPVSKETNETLLVTCFMDSYEAHNEEMNMCEVYVLSDDFYIMSGNTIPPFGNWDYADELSYTHYFSCATQAAAAGCNTYSSYSTGDLYAVDSSKKSQVMKEHRRQNVRTVYTNDQNHQQKQTMKQPRTKLNRARREATCHYAKPVDEDLYKIPPELIRAYKKKKFDLELGRRAWLIQEVKKLGKV